MNKKTQNKKVDMDVPVLEVMDENRIISIVESCLFATPQPQTVAQMKAVFKGTDVKTEDIKKALNTLTEQYADTQRGIVLAEIGGGYQIRTKEENVDYLKRAIKARQFRLSGPALEVISILAYNQPCIKAQVDEIRGVESGHLLRALMDRGLVSFSGKSEIPGKPMLYKTTKKFLEIFSLKSIKDLPTLAEINELIPEGIGEEGYQTPGEIGDQMSQPLGETYSENEDLLGEISEEVASIATTSEYFEIEKQRMKNQKEVDKAQDIKDALVMGEEVSIKDQVWLERYQKRIVTTDDEEKAAVGEETISLRLQTQK